MRMKYIPAVFITLFSILLEPGEWWNIGVLEENIPLDTKISSLLII